MIFYLGTHRPSWLARVDVPLFVSRRTMPKVRFPTATCRWALDSGGFSELSMYGAWTVEPAAYADEVRTYAAEIGSMDWAAIQDWMCEPLIRETTGLTVVEHQRRTVESLVTLRELAPEVAWVPVLQGWEVPDYLEHVRLYEAAGVDLSREPTVGVGSVCRRQDSPEINGLLATLARLELNLHGFGVKSSGLLTNMDLVASADSMAWSYHARKNPHKVGAPDCRDGHKNCANCMAFALEWRAALLAKLNRPKAQMGLFA